MMVESIISGIVAIAVCLISNIIQNNKTRALIEYRLDVLEKKQDKHNSVIERTFILEKDVAVLKAEIEGGK